MSKTKSQTFSAVFKARVALEAFTEAKTAQQITSENHLHPVQMTQSRMQMLAAPASVFEKGAGASQGAWQKQVEWERVERKIGRSVVEVYWLSKKHRGLGIDPRGRPWWRKAPSRISARRQVQWLAINRNRLDEREHGVPDEEDRACLG